MRTHAFTTLILSAFLIISCAGDAAHETPSSHTQEAFERGAPAVKPRIVLVHGAFADGTGWQRVIPLLQRRGYPVVAVQNPLTSFANDIETTRRVLDAESEKGPVVAVGHSYGGAVITGAAAGNPQVKALVYVNAWAPDADELLGDLLHTFGPGPLDAALAFDAAGYITIDRAKFRDIFCADVGVTEARVLAAVQKPISNVVFNEFVDHAAWHDIPSWYLVGRHDKTIVPELQRFMAERMGAHVREIASSHASLLSHPLAVVQLIEQAARRTRE